MNENEFFICYNKIPLYETIIDIIPMKSNTLLYQKYSDIVYRSRK